MSSESAPGELVFQPRKLPLQSLELPGAGTVHLWFLDLIALGNPLAPLEPLADDVLTVVQQRSLRRFYLRLLLGAYLGMPGKDVSISRAIRGKPRLDRSVHAGSQLEFSTANSNACCLIGVANNMPIGVDLELNRRRARNALALAHRYFSADEYQALQAYSDAGLDAAFMHTWACKEAVVKAAGHGIANQLCRFSVSVDPQRAPAMLAIEDDDPQAWRLGVFHPSPHHLGAVTVRHPSLRLEAFALAPPGR